MPYLTYTILSRCSPALAAELLELADQYMLDHLKQLCEARLTVSEQTSPCLPPFLSLG